MVMDQHLREYYESLNGNKVNDKPLSLLSNPNLVYQFSQDYISIPPSVPPDLGLSNLAMSSSQGDQHEDCDFNDVVLKYISQMLMVEDMDDKTRMFEESAALQEAEKSFYEVIYPPSPENDSTSFVDQFLNIPDDTTSENCSNGNGFSTTPLSPKDDSTTFVDQFLNILDETTSEYCSNGGDGFSTTSSSIIKDPMGKVSISDCDFARVPYQTNSQASFNSSSNSHGIDGFVDSAMSTFRVPDILHETEPVVQFINGLQEDNTFLPNSNDSFVDFENNGLLFKRQIKDGETVTFKVEENHKKLHFNEGSKGKKNRNIEGLDLDDGRSSKQSAIYTETTVRSEMFDWVLLCNRSESALREAYQNEASKSLQQKNGQITKGRGKKKGVIKDVVDLRTLLTQCAQAVAANDQRTTYELLKQIRQHSSPMGDGMQRTAHYFAYGLEARIAGSAGFKLNASIPGFEISAANVLKAYHLFLSVCPFKKLTNFFSNRTIMNVAEKATALHIIDFGILYGFQWPCLMQRLSVRPGGPPKLRITGIDFPKPGFRPAERAEETSRRLKDYAETFNIPFEFNAIAQKWETVQIEDLKLRDDEVIVVNTTYRFRSLYDETVMVESPRNMVLNLIKNIKPVVFIQGVVNGAYGAPFFITRFREALFHYSTLFDMLETNVPRESEARMLLENEIFGREAINVIACEGSDRIERPETYKQWQFRNCRAGFVQLPLNQEIMKMAKDRVKRCYHKDFLIDEDGHWMLQGWKGRIIYATSSWKPA